MPGLDDESAGAVMSDSGALPSATNAPYVFGEQPPSIATVTRAPLTGRRTGQIGRMAPNSPTARAVALRLLSPDEVPPATNSDTSEMAAAIERAFERLGGALTRWFGAFGYHALLSRSLSHAQRDHPALDGVRIRSATDPSLEGLAQSIARHGPDAVHEGIIATLVAFIDLLSRLIGDEMALRLIDQCETETDRTDPGGVS